MVHMNPCKNILGDPVVTKMTNKDVLVKLVNLQVAHLTAVLSFNEPQFSTRK